MSISEDAGKLNDDERKFLSKRVKNAFEYGDMIDDGMCLRVFDSYGWKHAVDDGSATELDAIAHKHGFASIVAFVVRAVLDAIGEERGIVVPDGVAGLVYDDALAEFDENVETDDWELDTVLETMGSVYSIMDDYDRVYAAFSGHSFFDADK